MATYNDENKSYASSSVGTAGLTLGVIGTTLASGILNNGVGGLFNVGNNAAITIASKDAEIARLQSEAAAVDRLNKGLSEVYVELRKQDKAQDAEIAALNSRVLALETSSPLREQIVLGQVQSVATSVSNLATQTRSEIDHVKADGAVAVAHAAGGLQSQINCIQNTLNGIVKTVVPNSSCCPGWGAVTVKPETT